MLISGARDCNGHLSLFFFRYVFLSSRNFSIKTWFYTYSYLMCDAIIRVGHLYIYILPAPKQRLARARTHTLPFFWHVLKIAKRDC